MGTRADFDIDVDVGNVCAQAGVGCIGVSTNEAQGRGRRAVSRWQAIRDIAWAVSKLNKVGTWTGKIDVVEWGGAMAGERRGNSSWLGSENCNVEESSGC